MDSHRWTVIDRRLDTSGLLPHDISCANFAQGLFKVEVLWNEYLGSHILTRFTHRETKL